MATEALQMLQKCFRYSTLSRTLTIRVTQSVSGDGKFIENLPHSSLSYNSAKDDYIAKVKTTKKTALKLEVLVK